VLCGGPSPPGAYRGTLPQGILGRAAPAHDKQAVAEKQQGDAMAVFSSRQLTNAALSRGASSLPSITQFGCRPTRAARRPLCAARVPVGSTERGGQRVMGLDPRAALESARRPVTDPTARTSSLVICATGMRTAVMSAARWPSASSMSATTTWVIAPVPGPAPPPSRPGSRRCPWLDQRPDRRAEVCAACQQVRRDRSPDAGSNVGLPPAWATAPGAPVGSSGARTGRSRDLTSCALAARAPSTPARPTR
jgi:hypothetical protein